ncbi:hypothetical protein MNBD_NITROSPIRAE02-8 [hydrothermal vent metagenome]|uniref:Uncharacterized protein n=1 Tax=hydrothermal vent metagenome TaxID=652676 RepID=A0A3B1DEA9_9ZZZZ
MSKYFPSIKRGLRGVCLSILPAKQLIYKNMFGDFKMLSNIIQYIV